MAEFHKVNKWTDEHAEKMLEKWGDPRDPPEKWWAWKKELLFQVSQLVIGDFVLDVGCGVGHLYSLLKDRKYLGVDYPDLVRTCRTMFPRGMFHEGTIYDLSGLGGYDTVLCIQVLIHLPDFNELVKTLWRHTEKRLIFTVFPPEKKERKWFSGGIYGITQPILGHVVSYEQFDEAIKELYETKDMFIRKITLKGKSVWMVVIDRQQLVQGPTSQ